MRRPCIIASLLLSMGFTGTTFSIAAETPAVEKIPSSLISSPTQITGDQRQIIAQYVKAIVDQMQALRGEQESQLPKLREQLIEPLRQAQVSGFFLTAYGNELAAQLAQAMKSDSDLIRLNGIILAQRAQQLAADLMVAALTDESPAVRYWAAKSIGQLSKTNLSPAIETKLVQALAQSCQGEEAVPVLQRMLSALSDLNTPASNQQLLATLTQRLSAKRPADAPAPVSELTALQDLFRKTAGLDRVDLDMVKSSAAVTLQYLNAAVPAYRELIAQADKTADKATADALRKQADGYLQIIDVADAWLPWSLKKLMGESVEPPLKLRQAIDAKQPAELDLRLKQWQQIMSQPPFADKKG